MQQDIDDDDDYDDIHEEKKLLYQNKEGMRVKNVFLSLRTI